MNLYTLNNALSVSTVILSASGAVAAMISLSGDHKPSLAKRFAAVFGVIGAMSALIVWFTGRDLHVVSEAMIQSLQSELRGPDLSDGQIATLARLLAPGPKPAGPVLVMSSPNNAATNLARKIKEALLSAGFTVDGVRERTVLEGTSPTIVIRQKTKNGEVGSGIVAALKMVGLESRIVASAEFPENRVEIIVGYQP